MASGDIDVAYVAKLARLALTPAEVERFGAQLGALLEHVDRLAALPVDDVVRPSLDRETVLGGAPERDGTYFRVPRIIGEDA